MKKRVYGIDLLRILSMFMIVALHVLRQGGILFAAEPRSAQYYLAWIFESLCLCAVNCYALISGYVGVDRKHRYYKIGTLWLQAVLSSLGITAVFRFAHLAEITSENFTAALLPITYNQYWYFTAYFALFFLMPFLNAMINSLEKRKLRVLAYTVVLLFSVLPTLSGSDMFNLKWGYDFAWIAALYVLGGITAKFPDKKRKIKCKMLLLYFIGAAVSVGFKFIAESGKTMLLSELLMKYNSLTMVLCAYSLFIIAVNSNIKSETAVKIIKTFSPLSFGIYIIHTNPLIFNVLKNRFSDYASLSPVLFIPAVILTAAGIFLICGAIDYIRLCLFRLMRLQQGLEMIENKITAKLTKNEVKLSEKV